MKVHLRDRKTKQEKYENSPHIYNAIKEGRWTVCKIIVGNDFITDDKDKITCNGECKTI